MSYPPDILNPESLADVLAMSCTTAVVEDPNGLTNILRLNTLVELLVIMYVPLDQYTKVLDEWAAQPEGKELPAAVSAHMANLPAPCPKCGGCGSVSVPGELADVFCPACRGTGSEDGGDFDNYKEEPGVHITIDKSLVGGVVDGVINSLMLGFGMRTGKQMTEARDARPCPKCGAAVGEWCKSIVAPGKNTIHRERLS